MTLVTSRAPWHSNGRRRNDTKGNSLPNCHVRDLATTSTRLGAPIMVADRNASAIPRRVRGQQLGKGYQLRYAGSLPTKVIEGFPLLPLIPRNKRGMRRVRADQRIPSLRRRFARADVRLGS